VVVLKFFGWIFGLSAACAAGLAASVAPSDLSLIEDKSFISTYLQYFLLFFAMMSIPSVVIGIFSAGIAAIFSRLRHKKQVGLIFPASTATVCILFYCVALISMFS
jgi:hypothetical protein